MLHLPHTIFFNSSMQIDLPDDHLVVRRGGHYLDDPQLEVAVLLTHRTPVVDGREAERPTVVDTIGQDRQQLPHKLQ